MLCELWKVILSKIYESTRNKKWNLNIRCKWENSHPSTPNFVSHSRTKQCHLKFINKYKHMSWFQLFQINNKSFFSQCVWFRSQECVQTTRSKRTVHQSSAKLELLSSVPSLKCTAAFVSWVLFNFKLQKSCPFHFLNERWQFYPGYLLFLLKSSA